jgi:GT2 family glycosyltransferase
LILHKIGIIVLNWQGWRDTLACLESLRQLIYEGPITLIVCDNASTDDSWAQIFAWAQQHYTLTEIGIFSHGLTKLATPFPDYPLVLIQTGANLGFAGGNNVGIRYALQQENPCEYLWLLNNDTTVAAMALAALYQHAQLYPQQALIGCTLLDFYQRNIVQCAGGCHYFPQLTIFRHVHGGELLSAVMQYDETTVKLDYVCGAALFLRSSVVQQIGLLNEDYFLFYEELDYTQRLKRHCYNIGWCKHSIVYHKGSASVGTTSQGDRTKLSRAHYYENLSTFKYTARFYPHWLPWVMLVRLVGKLFILIKRGDFYLFLSLFQAYRDFIRQYYWRREC